MEGGKMKASANGTVQVVTVLGIVAVSVIAAVMGKWEIVSMAMTGGFALLRSSGKEKENEKDDTSSDNGN